MPEPVSKIRRARPIGALGAALFAAIAASATETQPLDSIRSAAEIYVRSQLPPSQHETEVTAGTLDERLRFARCGQPLRGALAPGATLQSRVTVGVSCPGPKPWTVYVPVRIETHLPVLVLRRAATRGARLTADDVEIQTRKVSGTNVSYLTNPAELAGRTLKRPLAAGAVLTADAFADDVLVKRGQQVTLVYAAGGVEVRAPGRALENAPASGRVKVQNLSSLRVVEGVVETPSLVRVGP